MFSVDLRAITPALPFLAAALSQVLSSVVGRISSTLSRQDLERLARGEVVLADEATLPPPRRPRRSYSAFWTEAFNPEKISRVYAKNSDGATALIGTISLLTVTINSRLLEVSAYGLLVGVALLIGIASAVSYWVRDVDKYRGRRVLGISLTVFFLALSEILIAGVLVSLPYIPGAQPLTGILFSPSPLPSSTP